MALELPSVDSEIMKKVNNAIITVLTPKMNFYRNNTECSHEGNNCVIYERNKMPRVHLVDLLLETPIYHG